MEIRTSAPGDLDAILEIYACAREYMRRTGNPNQWGSSNPPEWKIRKDIADGNSYLVLQRGEICGVFSFILGADPTYQVIEGRWLNDEPYGTLHRVAGNGRARGLMGTVLDFCGALAPNVRVDTHSDNKIMQHILEKSGFTRCGIIHLENGSPRIAYQKKYS